MFPFADDGGGSGGGRCIVGGGEVSSTPPAFAAPCPRQALVAGTALDAAADEPLATGAVRLVVTELPLVPPYGGPRWGLDVSPLGHDGPLCWALPQVRQTWLHWHGEPLHAMPSFQL